MIGNRNTNNPTGPTRATIKRLFALSGNRCAFPKCTTPLIDGEKVIGKICHMKARQEGGPRYDPIQTAEERHGYENLILMCGRHHDVIDDDEDAYTIEYLHRLKARHEQDAPTMSEEGADHGTRLLLVDQSVSSNNQSGGITAHTIHVHNYAAYELTTNDLHDLNPREIELLWNAAKDPDGEILHSQTFDGEDIRTNGRHFLKDTDARVTAEWLGALRSLEGRGFIERWSSEGDFFKVTDKGYKSADHLDEFTRWNVDEIVLRAHYMNAPSEELTVTCKGVIVLPALYFDDQVGDDGSFAPSLGERRSLLVEGINSKPIITWVPNEIEFVDTVTGQAERFHVDGMQFLPPAGLKLPIP